MNDSYYSSLIWIYGHDTTTSVQLSEQSSNTNTAPHKSQNEWPQFKAYKTITQSNTSDLDSLNRSLAYKAKNTQQQLRDWRTRGKTKTSDHSNKRRHIEDAWHDGHHTARRRVTRSCGPWSEMTLYRPKTHVSCCLKALITTLGRLVIILKQIENWMSIA